VCVLAHVFFIFSFNYIITRLEHKRPCIVDSDLIYDKKTRIANLCDEI